jgi:excisionase family DNA binding protein
MSEPWRSVAEIAAYTGLSQKTIRRRAAALGGVRFGGRLLFRESAVDEALQSNPLSARRRAVSRA